MRRTYEILGYKTQEDFDNRNFEPVTDGLTVKRKTIALAKRTKKDSSFAVVKVQSSDREFVKVI